MRSILCFGDSNTWGYEAATEERLPWDVRWPGVLQRLLGPDVRILEEGLNGRSTMFDRPEQPTRNGNAVLAMLLEPTRRSTASSSRRPPSRPCPSTVRSTPRSLLPSRPGSWPGASR